MSEDLNDFVIKPERRVLSQKSEISSFKQNAFPESTPTKSDVIKNKTTIKRRKSASKKVKVNRTNYVKSDENCKTIHPQNIQDGYNDLLLGLIPIETVREENLVSNKEQSNFLNEKFNIIGSNFKSSEDPESCPELIPETQNQTISIHDQNISCSPHLLMDETYGEDTILKESQKLNFLENSNICNDESFFAQLNVTELSSSAASNIEQNKSDTFYDLPMKVKDYLFQIRGVNSLYDWQDCCLKLPAIKKHKNLIYSLPTSGGKTLVAELLIMKEILKQKKNAIFVLPYVSIVQEKVRDLSPFAVEFDFHIEEYAASKGILPPRKRRKKNSVYIATIEKANAIVNSLIELNREDELGMVVVDETEEVSSGEYERWYDIHRASFSINPTHAQVVGMSATFGNIEELKTFLSAEFYVNDFRPVELVEYVKTGDILYQIDKKSEDLYLNGRTITHNQNMPSALKSCDPDHVLKLAMDVIPQNSCLIFCPTKKNCESVALMLAKFMPRKLLEIRKEERQQLLKLLENTINGVCFTLKSTIVFGIAYHHSGLIMDERKLIEEAYSSGVLCLLCCTSTLAAGVNLPAKRVILRSPYIGNEFLTKSQYKQMIGRAGRAGIDASGESVLILQPKDKEKARALLEGPIGSCRSSLTYQDGKGFRHLLLSLLGLKICSCLKSMESFLKTTLYFIQLDETRKCNLYDDISREIDHLVKLNMVVSIEKEKNQEVLLTSLGQATFKGCMDIDRTPFVYQQLKHAQTGIVLANELHLLYLATPIDPVDNFFLKWMLYYNQVNKLNPVDLKTAQLIGVTENVLSKKASGKRCNKDSFDEFIYKRFFLALLLFELMKKKTVLQVSELYEVSRGFVQNLLMSSISYTSLLIHFTADLSEFWVYKLLFEALLARLSNTSNIELAPLLEIPGIKEARGRQLFKSGYRTIQQLACVNPEKLSADIQHLPRNQARLIIASAKMILQEKVDSLREEADELAALPL